MQRIIWSCWFQGRDQAPGLVRRCLRSWEERNPGWELRVLDARTLSRYVDLRPHVDLSRQTLIAASLSNIVRILLLHEYGGVWADATTFCNVPLDEWLPQAANTGFFAFARPGEDRLISSWFLAAESGNTLVGKWAARTSRFWRGRERATEYHWFHYQFGLLCAVDKEAFRAWQRVPQISAAGPSSVFELAHEDFDAVKSRIDWTVPLFKLSYRLHEPERVTPRSLLGRLLGVHGTELTATPAWVPRPPAEARPIALPQSRAGSVGDHIQSIAAENMLQRVGLSPVAFEERYDCEGVIPPRLLVHGELAKQVSEWPPEPACSALYLGVHIGPSHPSTFTSAAAVAHYRAHEPVGCGDRYTLSLLRSLGVDAFLSHCASLTFSRRLPDAGSRQDVFVVSGDRRILEYLPRSVAPFTFVSHESSSSDWVENRRHATELLSLYQDRAKLVVTTVLDCALPAVAMGIPVVVFYPPNDGTIAAADRARFSSLAELLRVFRPEEATLVDWDGYTADVGDLKLELMDRFCTMATRWGELPGTTPGPLAPWTALPYSTRRDYADPERVAELERTKSPDRQKWAESSSYSPAWSERARVAAEFIRDGARVLEIGTGNGNLRDLIERRCHYTGADLEPLDARTRVLDLDHDSLPAGPWDAVVVLGVLEHLYHPAAALKKIADTTSRLIISHDERVNLEAALTPLGFRLSGRKSVRGSSSHEEMVFDFSK